MRAHWVSRRNKPALQPFRTNSIRLKCSHICRLNSCRVSLAVLARLWVRLLHRRRLKTLLACSWLVVVLPRIIPVWVGLSVMVVTTSAVGMFVVGYLMEMILACHPKSKCITIWRVLKKALKCLQAKFMQLRV